MIAGLVQLHWTDGLTNFEHIQRWKTFHLYSVQGRLLRLDLIKYCKIICDPNRGADQFGLFQLLLHLVTGSSLS